MSEDLQRNLIQRFHTLGLNEGDVLPSEQDLTRDLAVSRPALREALAGLESLGLVTSKQGARRRLGALGMRTVVDSLTRYMEPSPSLLAEMLDIRRVLETAFFPAAVADMSPTTLRRLRRLVDQMNSKAEHGQPFLEEDASFHRVLYEHLDNATFQSLVAAFWRLFGEMSRQLQVGRDLRATARRHLRIVEALEAGDTPLAMHELNVHFFDVRARLTGYRRGGRNDASTQDLQNTNAL